MAYRFSFPILICAWVVVSASPAFAKNKRTNPVFSAIEDEITGQPLPKTARPKAKKAKPRKPERTASVEVFDAVPQNQTDAVMRRLQIVQELVQKFGRAYDYRTHTTSDLAEIRAQLEKMNALAAHSMPQTPSQHDELPPPPNLD